MDDAEIGAIVSEIVPGWKRMRMSTKEGEERFHEWNMAKNRGGMRRWNGGSRCINGANWCDELRCT